MKYIIKSILKEAPADYGKTRVAFKIEDDKDDRIISGFFQVVPEVGDEIDGEITQKDKWWNFNFPKRIPTGGSEQYDMLRRDINALSTSINMCLTMIKDIYSELTKAGVVKLSDGSDAPPF